MKKEEKSSYPNSIYSMNNTTNVLSSEYGVWKEQLRGELISFRKVRSAGLLMRSFL